MTEKESISNIKKKKKRRRKRRRRRKERKREERGKRKARWKKRGKEEEEREKSPGQQSVGFGVQGLGQWDGTALYDMIVFFLYSAIVCRYGGIEVSFKYISVYRVLDIRAEWRGRRSQLEMTAAIVTILSIHTPIFYTSLYTEHAFYGVQSTEYSISILSIISIPGHTYILLVVLMILCISTVIMHLQLSTPLHHQ